MKTTDYRLQKEIQNIKPDNPEWLKDYVRQVLESDKPYHAKCDYLGLSIQEIQNKIDYLSNDISEMSALKKALTASKITAMASIASVLAEYGIDRLDGTIISSLTITPKKTKLKETFEITNPEELIKMGFYSVIVDEEAVKAEMLTFEGMSKIDQYVTVGVVEEDVPAKIKVNSRRSSTNNQATELLNLVDKQEAA
ncbi:hypothetical protein [Sulfurimonas sp.]|uniref:hypothetical protein n=1 Tax=Sulfurimonas sp. TaxID=2022749 RepID=UPI003567EC98